MSVIEIHQITKDYGAGKGVFDVSFQVDKGEAVGFLGPNGAGKTTTIRQLMGFIKPDQGSLQILGHDCFSQADEIQKYLGYLPGEIAFMDDMNGWDFITFIAEMKGLHNMDYAKKLMAFLELDAKGKIKKMSKGMKQKIGIVTALMQDPEILILDEPTSGLDPLMQNKFVTLIQEAKKKGKTIVMSSHMFEEVEQTCDRVIMIKEGRIIADDHIEKLKINQQKQYKIIFHQQEEAMAFHEHYTSSTCCEKSVTMLWQGQPDNLLKDLSRYTIDDLTVRAQSLEEMFMHFYGGEQK